MESIEDAIWLTSRELAFRLKVKVCTLDKWAHHGTGPHFIKAGRVRRYSVGDVVAWEQALLAEARQRRQGATTWSAADIGHVA